MLLMNRINKLRDKFEDKGLLNPVDNSKVIIQANDGLFVFDNCLIPLSISNFKEEYTKHYKKIDKITKDLEKYVVYDCKHCKAENVYIQGDKDGVQAPHILAGIIPDNFNYDVWRGSR